MPSHGNVNAALLIRTEAQGLKLGHHALSTLLGVETGSTPAGL